MKNFQDESGALLRYTSNIGDEASYNILLLARAQDAHGPLASLTFRALVTYSDGTVSYDPSYVVNPVRIPFDVIVDPRRI